MKYKAVIFDLFGTLTCYLSFREYETVLRKMASVVSAPEDSFIRLWNDTFDRQMKGDFRNDQVIIRNICHELNVPVEYEQINRAVQMKLDSVKRDITRLRSDAVDVLVYLKSENYKTGLISNCSHETPILWKEVPLVSVAMLVDVAVFSCLEGTMKPDPRIYQIAAEQLGVEPKDCLYIADGIGGELESAAQIGMYPVQLRVIGEDHDDDPYHEDWDGPVISSLKEVLTLVNEME